jgi:hypothetical protein
MLNAEFQSSGPQPGARAPSGLRENILRVHNIENIYIYYLLNNLGHV